MHFELNSFTLDTDMQSKVEDGELRYTMNFDGIEEAVIEGFLSGESIEERASFEEFLSEEDITDEVKKIT